MKRVFSSVLWIAVINTILVLSLSVLLYGCTNASSIETEGANPIPTDIKPAEIEEGTVSVVSNGEAYEPYKSWSHGTHSGIAADAVQIMERGIENELETINYADDFEVRIFGSPLHVFYMTYTDDFSVYEGSTHLDDGIIIPVEKGTYIMRIEIMWGIDGNYDAYDYVFKLLIDTYL